MISTNETVENVWPELLPPLPGTQPEVEGPVPRNQNQNVSEEHLFKCFLILESAAKI